MVILGSRHVRMARMAALSVPEEIGPYRIVRRLGEGGMGIVFEAIRTDIGRRAAIKILKPEFAADEELSRRFVNEARAVIQVDSPGIVQVFDYGRLSDATPYIVMELLLGKTLAARLRELGRHMPIEEYLPIAQSIARTLGAAHARSVIHRDLKPDNIMLIPDSETDGRERVKLLDFGIAKLMADNLAGQTSTCVVMGTPEYMSPEQCRGARDVDDKTDIYSLGVLLFQMASGRRPFLGPSPGELIGQHQYQPAPHLAEVAPWTPSGLAHLVDRMLLKEPSGRPSILSINSELLLIASGLSSITARPLPELASETVPPTLAKPSASNATPQLAAQAVRQSPQRRDLIGRWAILGIVGLISVTGAGIWLKQRRSGLMKLTPQEVTSGTQWKVQQIARSSLTPETGQTVGPVKVDNDAVTNQHQAVVMSNDMNSTVDLANSAVVDLMPPDEDAPKEPRSLQVHPKRLVVPQHSPAEHLMDQVEHAFSKGAYEEAIKLAMQPEIPKSVAVRAWTLIGLSSCRKGDTKLLDTVYKRLSGPDRAPVIEACRRAGISFSSEGTPKLIEQGKKEDQSEFDLARFEARRFLELGQFSVAIERAETAMRTATDAEQQASLWYIVGLAACQLRDISRVNRAVKNLLARPGFVQSITDRCDQRGVVRANDGIFY